MERNEDKLDRMWVTRKRDDRWKRMMAVFSYHLFAIIHLFHEIEQAIASGRMK